jgi:hypothetical protein
LILHVTNGDCAVDRIRPLGLGGEILPWRDVLHEGPVPAPATLDSLRPLRAKFLSSGLGGGPSAVDVARDLEQRDRRLGPSPEDDEVALWFEHDLYDQLQLAQILDAWGSRQGASDKPRLTLAQADDYLGHMDQGKLRALWEARRDVTDEQLEAARRAWGAFSSPDPRAIEAVLDDVSALPFMRPSLVRHLEEFPSVDNGLSRTERQALEALVEGGRTFRELFPAAHHQREEAIFLGDSVLYSLLKALAPVEDPLVSIDDVIALTSHGRDVLAGRRDRVATIGIDRWLGGVHLKGRRVPYRWDPRARRIVT